MENNKKDIKLSDDVMNVFYKYNWSGNIRELKNCMEGIVVLSEDNNIKLSDIPSNIIDTVNNNDISYKNLNIKNNEAKLIKIAI